MAERTATMTICVYGDFVKKDIRVKVFPDEQGRNTKSLRFRNTLRDAGYDAILCNSEGNEQMEIQQDN